jgi:cystathionine beta-lyase
VPWVNADHTWSIDWDALDAAVTPQTKLFYLCNPHNPIGRVWRRDELERLGEFCDRHDLILISDEIHCDLILDDQLPHLPSATINPGLAARSITLMAPSKTYNVPGLGCSLAIIPDDQLRRQFERACRGLVAEVTPLGYAACEAAYGRSEDWRQQLLATLRHNTALIERTVAELPGVRLVGPQEATYLSWINIEELGLDDALAHFESHGIGFSDGVPFGAKPNSHLRLNFGCPASVLEEGLRRFAAGVAAAPTPV